MAATTGHTDVVRFLVENHANVNAVNLNKVSALMEASWRGHAGVVGCLVEQGSEINAATKNGSTALMWAAKAGRGEVVACLVDHGADVNDCDVRGQTSLMLAVTYERADVAFHLVEHDADVNKKDCAGTTALMLAAEIGHLEVVRYLVDHGADSQASNKAGQTATRLAATSGHHDVVRALTSPITDLGSDEALPVADPAQSPSWIIPPFELKVLEFVESKTIGGDFRAKWFGSDVVVKRYDADASNASFTEEVLMWQQLRHPNILKLYGACMANLPVFVCEYASNGSIGEYLSSCDAEHRAPWKLLLGAALGVQYLHERRIIHGNLRGCNILVGSDGLAKLADFRLSRSTRVCEPGALPTCVSPMRWRAPENLNGERASFASDVYALGLCIAEALTGKPPWANAKDDETAEYHKRRWELEKKSEPWHEPAELPDQVRDWVWRMCCQDPKKRAPLSAVVCQLETLVVSEDNRHATAELTTETAVSIVDNWINRSAVWSDIKDRVQPSTNTPRRRALDELKALIEALGQISDPVEVRRLPSILDQLHSILVDFSNMLAGSDVHAAILRLSSTLTSARSVHAFYRRIEGLWRMVDGSTHDAEERKARWCERREEQVEVFVSEVSETCLLLSDLELGEERAAFLAFLKLEMEHCASDYTAGQLCQIQRAYAGVASRTDAEVAMTTRPEWFIPWYELVIDKWSPVGGGS